MARAVPFRHEPPARRAARAGLGLVEAMIALAISAMLLTAVAAAFTASSQAITENDEFFQATHTGRVALSRILTQVRRGVVNDTSTTTNLKLLTDTGLEVAYQYDSANKQLKLLKTTNGVSTSYVLARNVSAAQFNCQTGTDYQGASCVTRVSVALTVQVKNNQMHLSGTAAPRRNLAY